jgi:general secretion pathway protein D
LKHGQQWPDAGAVDGATSHDGGLVHAIARDGGMRAPVVAALPPPPPPPPSPPGPPSTSLPISDLGFNTCHKVPAGKRAVKATLKPDIELPELIAWISSITCKSFVLPGTLSAGGKKVTLYTQGMMTPREAYAAFLAALDSIGLTVEQGPGFLRIIETSKAKTGAVPVYGFDGQPTSR